MSTTHVDLQGDSFVRSALVSSAQQVRSSIKPILLEHDFERQIGIILDARVHELSDGEFGLFGLGGIFETEEERALDLNGGSWSRWVLTACGNSLRSDDALLHSVRLGALSTL